MLSWRFVHVFLQGKPWVKDGWFPEGYQLILLGDETRAHFTKSPNLSIPPLCNSDAHELGTGTVIEVRTQQDSTQLIKEMANQGTQKLTICPPSHRESNHANRTQDLVAIEYSNETTAHSNLCLEDAGAGTLQTPVNRQVRCNLPPLQSRGLLLVLAASRD